MKILSLTYVFFSVLLERVAGEAGEDQPHDKTHTTPSHFHLKIEL